MTDPNWYPDPTGRFEVRYFDGEQWTEHVATAGAAATDPLPDTQSTVAVSSPVQAPGFGSVPQPAGPPQQAGPPPGFGSYPTQEGWPAEPQPSGPNKGVVGLLAVLAAVVLLVIAGAFLLLAGDDDGDGDTVEALTGSESEAGADGDTSGDSDGDDSTTSSSTTAAPSSTTSTTVETTTTTTPTTISAPPTDLPPADDPRAVIPEYGSDANLDRLADECQAGDMGSCDTLFFDSPLDSGYEAYGDSCGGRNRPAGFCVSIYPE